jgi:2-aminomuconate deaminase
MQKAPHFGRFGGMAPDATSSAHNSSRAPEPVGLYPHARRAGNLLFLSGVGPRQRGQQQVPGVELATDGTVVAYDFERQCHAVFQNVRYILEEAGARWEDLVDVTVYLTNMRADFPTYNRLYAEYFQSNQPCRTTVEVNCLPTPIAIELKCIAVVS